MKKDREMDLKNIVPKRCADAAFRVIDGEAVVVLPSRSEVKILNKVGSRIWQLMDGKQSAADICKKVCEEYDISEKAAQSDILDFIKELGDQGMLES